MRQAADQCSPADSAMIQDLLKLCCRFPPLARLQVSLSANVIWCQARCEASLIRRCNLKKFDRFARVAVVDLNLTSDRWHPNVVDHSIGREALLQLIHDRRCLMCI